MIHRLKMLSLFCGGAGLLTAAAVAGAAVQPNSLFTDGAVLQREVELPVFGTARDGEAVTVRFAGQERSTVAAGGRWQVKLRPLAASAQPRDMEIKGDQTLVIHDLVVGDVWVASGQSNMERQLGPRMGQKELDGWKEELARADYPLIRQYYVPEKASYSPVEDAGGAWSVCSTITARDFSAVGYYFAREIHRTRQVPVGILFSAWGGTPAEVWTSAEGIASLPEFKTALAEANPAGEERIKQRYREAMRAWYARNDPGVKQGWKSGRVRGKDWTPVQVPYKFPEDYDGIIWFCRDFDVPAGSEKGEARLELGAIDDADTTWINGVEVGSCTVWDEKRHYPIPAGLLKAGKNRIAIRVLDTGWPGGFSAQAEDIKLVLGGRDLPLAGTWMSSTGKPFQSLEKTPAGGPSAWPTTVTVLYNSMLGPLTRFPIKGAIWYQGEGNVGREAQYQRLFPVLIQDWRRHWGVGDFPFLFVQIAPYNSMTPEIREAQRLTLQRVSNTAMAVTLDIGDAQDIHPTHKEPVGVRLALAARALAYGEALEYSGPAYRSLTVQDGRARVAFDHLGGGLVAKGGSLRGFEIAGADKVYVPAQAEIRGEAVEVWSPKVPTPVAVRYGWSNVPEATLFNRAGLPASSFSSDSN